uniref:Uncharacterized protein n=1 Tax=Arundo donax TaxID=35708 RepID=A0A0A8Y9E1_ARUDO
MHPALLGDLDHMKLSAKMSDQLRGCKLVSFALLRGHGCAVLRDGRLGRGSEPQDV